MSDDTAIAFHGLVTRGCPTSHHGVIYRARFRRAGWRYMMLLARALGVELGTFFIRTEEVGLGDMSCELSTPTVEVRVDTVRRRGARASMFYYVLRGTPAQVGRRACLPQWLPYDALLAPDSIAAAIKKAVAYLQGAQA